MLRALFGLMLAVLFLSGFFIMVSAQKATLSELSQPSTPLETQARHLYTEASSGVGIHSPNSPDQEELSRSDSETHSTPYASPSSDTELLFDLDQMRDAGPQAVVEFVDRQPDPDLPLLQAAIQDAQPDQPVSRNPSALQIASINTGTCAFSTIQAAIAAAASGATIRVATGVFTESIDLNAKNLTIVGGYDSTCTILLVGKRTKLTASGAGSVIDANSSVLTIRNFELTGGSSFGGGLDLLSGAKATLVNTAIHHNTGMTGAGIYVSSSSAVTLSLNSDVYSNKSSSDGGGAAVFGKLVGLDPSSSIYYNSAVNGGGFSINNGRIELIGSAVVGNTATNQGGGIYAINSDLYISSSAQVGNVSLCCQSAANGGGIYASNTTISLQSSSITNNSASQNGGGIYLFKNSVLNISGGFLGNALSASAGNDAVLGAGLFAVTSTVNFQGSIINNIAQNSGGGIYAEASKFMITSSKIGGTGNYEPNRINSTGLNGGGIYLAKKSTALIDNTVIASNTLTNPATGYGGGLYVRSGSVVTMTNSQVKFHSLPSIIDGRGAGFYIYDATVTLTNSQVLSNTAHNFAAGIRIFGTSKLNLGPGVIFRNNLALNGSGGAIALTGSSAIKCRSGSFANNYASASGGAIYADAGSIILVGAWSFDMNHALLDGGAVALAGTASASFNATTGASRFNQNQAGRNGGAINTNNNRPVQLYSVSANPFIITANAANNDGGFAYANSGAFFDVYGNVQASANTANRNGGVFSLINSTIWLDDYFTYRPRLTQNSAALGGAIYASKSLRVECDGADFGSIDLGNQAAGSGGALYLSGSQLLASNCAFSANRSVTGNGGAIAAYTSTLSIDVDFPPIPDEYPIVNDIRAVSATACNPFLQQCSSFNRNSALGAAGGFGGALFINNSKLVVNNTYFHRNNAQRGGAIYQDGAGSTAKLSNILVYSNTSAVSYGAGIRLAGGVITITQGTLANNTGGAGFSQGSDVKSFITNSIIWGNSAGAFSTIFFASCSIDQAGVAGPAKNPQFTAPGGGENYQLNANSAALNACLSGLPKDIRNQIRPQNGKFDMGAFEINLVFLPFLKR